MGYYTDNPLRDADHYDRQQQKWLDSLPRCAGCGEPIQDSVWYEVGRRKYCLECEDIVWSKVKGEYLSV